MLVHNQARSMESVPAFKREAELRRNVSGILYLDIVATQRHGCANMTPLLHLALSQFWTVT
jgi:hypothetical protein